MVEGKKKILIHSIVFSPDGVSTAYLYNDIALSFKNRGYDVIVLTTTPHYNVVQEELVKQPLKKRAFGLYYESNFENIRVMHVPQKKYKLTLFRMIGFVYWHVLSFILGISQKRVDYILSPSPPLTIGLINLLIAKFKRAKVVYNVQEIYPDFLIEQGGLTFRPIIKILKFIERLVYNKSDAVTTIDQVFYDTIVNRFDDRSKLHIVPNFVDTSLYRPLDSASLSLDPTVFVQNENIKLMYAGNIGHAQDWEPLLQTAKALRDEAIEFYIIGEGVMKAYLQQQVHEYGLSKVHILPYQPRELMPQLLAFSDLQFIFMSREMEGHGFPSKVYTIMACAKPLIVCSGVGSPIYSFLKQFDCAKLIITPEIQEKTNCIVSFLTTTTKEHLRQMGSNGLDVIERLYSKDIVTEKYVTLISTL